MVGFGVTNIGLGILAEYLWRTLDASRKRPVFIIDEIFELTNNGKINNSNILITGGAGFVGSYVVEELLKKSLKKLLLLIICCAVLIEICKALFIMIR